MSALQKMRYILYSYGSKGICFSAGENLILEWVYGNGFVKMPIGVTLCSIKRILKEVPKVYFFVPLYTKGYIFPISVTIEFVDNTFMERQILVLKTSDGKVSKGLIPDQVDTLSIPFIEI